MYPQYSNNVIIKKILRDHGYRERLLTWKIHERQ
jgi:hypothetical protein